MLIFLGALNVRNGIYAWHDQIESITIKSETVRERVEIKEFE